MKEEIINGINYRLDEETLTAEVIEKSGGYEGGINIPGIAGNLPRRSSGFTEISFIEPVKCIDYII